MKLTSALTSRLSSVWHGLSRKVGTRRSQQRRSPLIATETLEARDVPSGMAVGMNLDWITDYAPAWVFKDAFLQSRSWMSWDYNTVTGQATQGNRPVQVDSNGWPTRLDQWTNDAGQAMQQRLQTMMFQSTGGTHPTGVYHAQWRGTGRITFLGDGAVTSQGTLADGTNFAELNVATATNAGIHLRIDSMSTADPIRDIDVWMPDYNGESFVGQAWRPGSNVSPFHPLFLERLEPFDRIRFMQPASTVTSDIVTWDDRRPGTYSRQSSFGTDFQNGMSPEYMIELANELHVNPWFNMPHMANDDYVRNFATLVRDTLDPSLTANVEWSNEVWNWAPGFESHYWARAQAAAEGIPLEQFVARETVRDFDIWSQVFAGQEQRIVRTIGGFAAAPGQYGWNALVMSRMNGHFDALAIAPYVAPTQATRATYTTATTVDQVIADTRATIAPMSNLVRQAADLVRQYEASLGRDLQLVGYEGGTHLDANNGVPYQRAFFEANGDPRLYDVLGEYLVAMEDAGLDSLDYYKLTDRRVASLLNNDFGTLNRMDQPLATAHRYRALLDYIGATPNDPPPPPATPVVSMTVTDGAAAEAGLDVGVLTVTRTGATTTALSVTYTVSGTATSSSDYIALTGTLTIPAGQTSATITITPLDDTAVEANESIIVTLTDGAAYDLGATSVGTVTLTSDDVARPRVSIAVTDANAAEANRDPGVFTVSRATAATTPVTVRYTVTGTATSGADFNALSGTVDIPANQTSATITITPIDDTAVESNETIIVTLSANAAYELGTTTSGTVTLTSNDVAAPLPEVAIVATDAQAAEQARDQAVFTFKRRGGDLTRPLTIAYGVSGTATNGTDYGRLSGTVTIPANQTQVTLPVVPVDDAAVESSETVILTLSTSSTYSIATAYRTATASIADNDRAATTTRSTASLRSTATMQAELEIAGLNALLQAQRAELS